MEDKQDCLSGTGETRAQHWETVSSRQHSLNSLFCHKACLLSVLEHETLGGEKGGGIRSHERVHYQVPNMHLRTQGLESLPATEANCPRSELWLPKRLLQMCKPLGHFILKRSANSFTPTRMHPVRCGCVREGAGGCVHSTF